MAGEDEAVAEAAMNDTAQRANDLAVRMQQHGFPMDVAVKRGTGPNGAIGINIQIQIGILAQIVLYETLLDILEAKEALEE